MPNDTQISGDVVARRLKFGTYETIDVSSLGNSLLYEANVPTVVLSRAGGMYALDVGGADQKGLGVSITSSGSAANIAGSAFDFGTGSGCLEAWATIESESGSGISGDRYLFQVGTTTQTWIVVYCNIAAAGAQTWKAEIKASDGTVLWATTDGNFDSYATLTGGPSTRPIHVVTAWARTSNTLTLKVWLNGALVINADKTTTSSSTKSISLGLNTVANSGIYIGARGANTSFNWPGRIYTLRTYKAMPTDLEVNTRNKLGPLNLPDKSKPVWYLDFQNQGGWSNSAQPEAYDGSGGAKLTTFNANGTAVNLSTQLIAYPGGEFPSSEVGGRGWPIPAHTPVRLSKGTSNVVVYSESAVDGIAWMTGIK